MRMICEVLLLRQLVSKSQHTPAVFLGLGAHVVTIGHLESKSILHPSPYNLSTAGGQSSVQIMPGPAPICI